MIRCCQAKIFLAPLTTERAMTSPSPNSRQSQVMVEYEIRLWFWRQVGEEDLTEMIRCCQAKIFLAPLTTERAMTSPSPNSRQSQVMVLAASW